jgi:hypothetical protein
MPTAQRRDRHEEMKEHERETMNAVIGEQVIHILGEPGDLLQMQIRLLWENSYRVNVLIGADAACAKVANSYFVKTDGDGNIVESTPQITKQY